MQEPDNNIINNNNNSNSDREELKRRISSPISNPNPYANANIEDFDAGTPWSRDTVSLGGYQVPNEQAELRYDGGRGADF